MAARKGFLCIICQQKKPMKQFAVGYLGNRVQPLPLDVIRDGWCLTCYDAENARVQSQERIGGALYRRPPKFAIDPDHWKDFGY